MELINQIGAVFGVSVLVIAGVVALFGYGKKNTQDVIRTDNKDLRDSNAELRTEKATSDALLKEKDETIRNLRDVATQTPAVKKLIEMNMQIAKQTNEQHVQVISELSNVATQMGDLAKEISGMAKVINQRFNPDTEIK